MKPASNFSRRPKKKTSTGKASGDIRIIGGQWRGRRLKVFNREGLRPTTDRVKETLFNWLMTDVRDATVLDCFSGAGSLGFEAASRFASHVTCIEKDKQAASQLKQNCEVLKADKQIQVLQGDFFVKVKALNTPYNLVFIDPPFHKNMVEKVFEVLIEQNLLAENALIYLEQESNGGFNLANSEYGQYFELLKEKSAGQVSSQLLAWRK